MYAFSNNLKSDIMQKMQKSSSVTEVATFLVSLGSEKFLRFTNNMKQIFPGAKLTLNKDVKQLAKDIQ
jgi:hypothetical protein